MKGPLKVFLTLVGLLSFVVLVGLVADSIWPAPRPRWWEFWKTTPDRPPPVEEEEEEPEEGCWPWEWCFWVDEEDDEPSP
tara:strand:- start:434 stop:673 length:240 start_codon:yes stop_codon:yes gene_type:complete